MGEVKKPRELQKAAPGAGGANRLLSESAAARLSYAILAVLVVMLGVCKISLEDDFFWHLATGRWIAEHGRVPATDVFGFVSEGRPWIPFEWGWDLLTYGLYSLTGNYAGIQVLSLLMWLGVAGLLVAAMRRYGVPAPVTVFVTLLTLAACLDRMRARPHSVSALGLAAVLYLHTASRVSPGPGGKRLLFFLPPIFLLWANMHPGVLAGLLLVYGLLAGEILLSMLSSRSAPASGAALLPLERPGLFRFAGIAIACSLVLLVNPHGFETIAYVVSHTQMKMLSAIQEWYPPFGNVKSSGVLVSYKIAVILGSFSLVYAVQKRNPVPALLYVCFALASLRAVRFMADYAVAGSLGTALGLGFLLQRAKSPLKGLLSGRAALLFLSAFMIAVIAHIPDESLYFRYFSYYRRWGFGLDRDYFSLPLVEFLKANDIRGRPFNQFETGGQLVWERPGEKNFIDSRNLGDDLFEEYDSILRMRAGFRRKLDAYGIDYVLLRPPDMFTSPATLNLTPMPFLTTYRSTWKLVYWDDIAFLYVKNLPKFSGVIAQWDYKVLQPYLLLFGRKQFDSLRTAMPDALERELARKRAEEPDGSFLRLFEEYLGAFRPSR